ncbi:MAG TPA: flagellar hook protein FlgE [Myxococcaceae bacterium]|nr:flagellar hook protein FlgE [Myxococcaceae bacterium]
MSLMRSLYSGATGLETNSLDLSVIGDNIANANTIGFKRGRAAFEAALSQTLIGSQGEIGLGAQLQAVQKIIAQGALTNTGLATDLALQGDGFFAVKGTADGQSGTFYTRAGQFTLDKTGYLVNLDGLRVQGFTADATGALGTAAGDLLVGNAASSPLATANVTLKANLQADATVPAAWDPTSWTTAAATSNASTGVKIYDSLGAEHQVQIYFRKTGAGAWEWHALTDGAGVQGGTAGTPSEISAGTLAFDNSGKLTAVTQAGTFNPVGATQPQALTFNFGTPSPGGTGLDGVTQFAGASATSFVGQDGYGSGELSSISIDTQGKVTGAFSNGTSRVLAQVGVATFAAQDKLEGAVGNLYRQTSDSGDPSFGAPGTGGRASVVAGALEQSNVDLASEFVRMIAAQRGFEANSKTLQTADQLLSELIAIKR